jgi:hypothetical protein
MSAFLAVFLIASTAIGLALLVLLLALLPKGD